MYQFTEVQEGIAQLRNQRSERASQYLQIGLKKLAEAVSNDVNPTLLAEAGEALIAAVESNRSDPDAYGSLAFLFVLTDQIAEAVACLQNALAHAPRHAQSLALLAYLQQPRPAHARLETDLPTHTPSSSKDELSEYIETEEALCPEMLEQELKELISALNRHYARPLCEPSERLLAETQLNHEALLRHVHRFQLAISDCENESETGYLYQLLALCERRADDLKSDISSLNRLLSLDAEIQRICYLARDWSAYLMHPPEPINWVLLESRFEGLLDACDAVADRLDMLDAQGVSIAIIKPRYKTMLGHIEALQQALDDPNPVLTKSSAGRDS